MWRMFSRGEHMSVMTAEKTEKKSSVVSLLFVQASYRLTCDCLSFKQVNKVNNPIQMHCVKII